MFNKYVIGAAIASTFTLVPFAVYMDFVGRNVLLGTVLTFAVFAIIYGGLYSQFKAVLSSLKTETPPLKEGLQMLSSSKFPESESSLLLADWYPENKPFHPSALTYDTMWKDYPTFPARSMKTNLIKYWDNPSNGTCSLPWMCDAFYKKITPEKIVEPAAPEWGSGIRVNFYDTCLFQRPDAGSGAADV
jgi:hypothetical protein